MYRPKPEPRDKSRSTQAKKITIERRRIRAMKQGA